MAIAFKAAGTVLEETGTSHEVAAPGGLADDDFMLLVACTIAGTAHTLTNDEGGWTKLAVEALSTTGTDTALAAWYKVAASESGTYTVSHSGSETFKGVIVTYTGVDTTTPMDATPTKNENVSDSDTHTPASITVATDQAAGISLIAKGGGSADGTVPSGYTLRAEGVDGSGPYMGVADDLALSTGSHQPPDWTDLGSAADSSTITALLRPSSDAVSPKAAHLRRMMGAQ